MQRLLSHQEASATAAKHRELWEASPLYIVNIVLPLRRLMCALLKVEMQMLAALKASIVARKKLYL